MDGINDSIVIDLDQILVLFDNLWVDLLVWELLFCCVGCAAKQRQVGCALFFFSFVFLFCCLLFSYVDSKYTCTEATYILILDVHIYILVSMYKWNFICPRVARFNAGLTCHGLYPSLRYRRYRYAISSILCNVLTVIVCSFLACNLSTYHRVRT